MIKINVVAVGRVKEKYFQEGVLEYLKRLSKYASVKIIEVKEETFLQGDNPLERQRLIDKEGEEIIRNLRGKVIALCVEGEKKSSEKFAVDIKRRVDCGEELTFVIGGSYGLSKKVKDLADSKISFSDMTFPHTLARLILVEQIYRAFTIINNATYHK